MSFVSYIYVARLLQIVRKRLAGDVAITLKTVINPVIEGVYLPVFWKWSFVLGLPFII